MEPALEPVEKLLQKGLPIPTVTVRPRQFEGQAKRRSRVLRSAAAHSYRFAVAPVYFGGPLEVKFARFFNQRLIDTGLDY